MHLTIKFVYNKNADRIREAVSIYYAFIKTWRKPKLNNVDCAASSNVPEQTIVDISIPGATPVEREDFETRLLRYEGWLKGKKQLSDKTANIDRQALRSFASAANEHDPSFILIYAEGDEIRSALNGYLERSRLFSAEPA